MIPEWPILPEVLADDELRARYAVLFGQSPNSLQMDGGVQEKDKEFASSGGYFARRITRMLNTENFGKSKAFPASAT